MILNYEAARREYARLQRLAYGLDGINPKTFNQLCREELESFQVSPAPANWIMAAINVLCQIERNEER